MGKFAVIGVALASAGVIGIAALCGVQTHKDASVTEQLREVAPVISTSPTPSPNAGVTFETDHSSTHDAAEDQPEIRLYTVGVSNSGGEEQMDECPGGFTEMTVYQGLGDLRLLSAHNNCGGDVVLPMQLGDHVLIEGEGEYVITDLRDTPKKTTTESIYDMTGSILLQTCYYGQDMMKFVALTPVPSA